MTRIVIHVDGRIYTPVDEWATTRAEIVRAARSGGGFVSMVNARGVTDVFVSAASSIHMELLDDEPPAADPDASFPDFDAEDL